MHYQGRKYWQQKRSCARAGLVGWAESRPCFLLQTCIANGFSRTEIHLCRNKSKQHLLKHLPVVQEKKQKNQQQHCFRHGFVLIPSAEKLHESLITVGLIGSELGELQSLAGGQPALLMRRVSRLITWCTVCRLLWAVSHRFAPHM